MTFTKEQLAEIREEYLYSEDKHGFIDRMCEEHDMTRTQLLKALGMNARELAADAGAKKQPPRQKRYTQDVVDGAVAAVMAGESRAEVAARVGCSRPSLDKWVREARAAGVVSEKTAPSPAPPTPEEQVKDYVTKDVYLPKRKVKVRPDGRIEITIQVIVEPMREELEA